VLAKPNPLRTSAESFHIVEMLSLARRNVGKRLRRHELAFVGEFASMADVNMHSRSGPLSGVNQTSAEFCET
jgi:hypothetical protein